MKNLLVFYFLTFGVGLSAQNGVPPAAGARGVAMGGTRVCFQDIFSAFGNQAGLAGLKSTAIGVMGEQDFLLPELRSVGIAAALPTASGTFALNLNYYGFEGFNQQKVGLAYARRLFDNFSIGAQFDYLSTRIPTYGSASTFTFELGLQWQISSDLLLGVHTYSPAVVRLTDEEKLPTLLSFGLAYQPAQQVLICVDLEKDIQFPLRVRGGMEYQVIDLLWLRTGFASHPSEASFGLGLYFDQLKIDLASQYNLLLGWTPAIGLAYQVN